MDEVNKISLTEVDKELAGSMRKEYYKSVRNELLNRGFSVKDVGKLLQLYDIENKLNTFTAEELGRDFTATVNDIIENEKIYICSLCKKAVLEVFED